MKFYIVSPWRNADSVKSLSDAIVAHGHLAHSFLDCGANLATGTSVNDEFKRFSESMVDWEADSLVKGVFECEMQALRDCDAVILLEPAGRSSLGEAGIAYGLGKSVVLVGLAEHPEVVYLICEKRYPTVQAFLDDTVSW
jgi:hypothetical protein